MATRKSRPEIGAVREAANWSPSSWQSRPHEQQPVYPDAAELERALKQLHELPPLVTSWEILSLKNLLADAAEGRRFLLQGGDCAESFDDCTSPLISNRLKVMLQMSLVLVHGMKLPIVRVGRFAGQYAKPRSTDNETRGDISLPSYRGDLVNAPAFDAASRRPDPQRLIKGHAHSAMTMNFVRALIDGGFADLRQWGWFNLSTHFPWIGMRTAALDGAHVEYFRGIRNPIAVKIGPSVTPDQLMRLVDVLDPDDEPGRLTLIHRMGAAKVESALPPLLAAIKAAGRKPLFCCDPMHGNTETLGNGFKTRRFQNIRDELDRAFDIHAAAGTRLGGVHLELTGENVTECMGGARDITETDLTRAYKSTVDPRLNYEQSLELAMLIVRKRGGVPVAV